MDVKSVLPRHHSRVSPRLTLFGIYWDGYIWYIEHKCPKTGPCTRTGWPVPMTGIADDCKLLARSEEEAERLLRATAERCAMARMQVSPLKPRAILFPAVAGGPLFYEGTTIQIVTEIRHLGVTLLLMRWYGSHFRTPTWQDEGCMCAGLTWMESRGCNNTVRFRGRA